MTTEQNSPAIAGPVERRVSRPNATWSLSLDCECPSCGEYVDLLEYPDFWDGRRLDACEHDTERSLGVDVVCPECGHDFEVDLNY
ncbi:MAG: hypothetical protein EPN17_00880 [Methylobacter sp.]|nr:MAG: hypothetical protein EPN17_00880 [Methylobacter sp.]